MSDNKQCWVCKVLLHAPQVKQAEMFATPEDHKRMQDLLDSGDLYMLPADACIAEPLELFQLEEDAHAHREQLKRDDPEGDYRVVIVTDVRV